MSRVIYAEGRSLGKINGRTVPFGTLSQVAGCLLALHGQNAASRLLDEKNHRLFLDGALDDEGQRARENFEQAFGAFRECRKNLEEMEARDGGKEAVELYEYQMAQIARVDPKKGEEEALEAKLRSLQTYEKDYEALSTANLALSGGEKGKGAVFLLSAAARKLERLGDAAPYNTFRDALYDLSARAQDLEKEVSFALSEMGDGDPGDEMDQVQKRLDALYRLKTHFHMTCDEVLDHYEELKQQRDLTLRRKDDIKREQVRLKELEEKMLEAGKALSRAREKKARELEREIHGTLSFLDMPKMRFFVALDPAPPSPQGLEKVSFRIAANTGEGIKPLSQVASGGEMSRVMLALTLKLFRAKDAETLVFDEIDTGISGATAQRVGVCLKMLGDARQVFCVTHSAQVATLAQYHFLVDKKEEEGRTETSLTLLSPEESLRENARLLGGKEITSEALSAARELRAEGEREWTKFRDTGN